MESESEYYFEGPEKNLEVWFYPNPSQSASSGKLGLRGIPRTSWEELLREVRCTILSETNTDFMDSFVLSESSMFITPFRFILKTCGQTTLLFAVPKLLELARSVGLTAVQELFFSRHHLGRPELQFFPHKSFADEMEFLDKHFEGSAFTLGKLNDKDTCYLYTLDSNESSVHVADQTLEILMHELDQDAMRPFFKSSDVQTFQRASELSGIAELFPDAILDGFLFDPCGYSVNGMMGPYFFTIHITPQDAFSFASFETDMPMQDYDDLIHRVLSIFRPGRATVTVMANHESGVIPSPPKSSTPAVKGFPDCVYNLGNVQRHELSGYHVVYGRYRKGAAASSLPTRRASAVPSPTPTHLAVTA